MKVTFGDKKTLNQCYSAPAEGQFALDADGGKSLHWDHCREQFLGKFLESINGFYYSHKHQRGEDVAGFVLKFEEIINSESQNNFPFSTFSQTEKDNILWIQPSSFWKTCLMKKSLLTLLVRCGLNYCCDKDNFDDALFAEHNENRYARETKNAVMRFLFGFTKFTGSVSQSVPVSAMGSTSTLIRHGWHVEFEKNTIYDVRRKLIRPEGENPEVSLVGIESLWG